MDDSTWYKIASLLVPVVMAICTGVVGVATRIIVQTYSRSRQERANTLHIVRQVKNDLFELRTELETLKVIPVKLKFPSPPPAYLEEDAG